MVKITEVELQPLRGKYYSTEIAAAFIDEAGRSGHIYIEVSGFHSQPSDRELENGWQPDEGMDHVEGQVQYLIGKAIVEMLEGKSW